MLVQLHSKQLGLHMRFAVTTCDFGDFRRVSYSKILIMIFPPKLSVADLEIFSSV